MTQKATIFLKLSRRNLWVNKSVNCFGPSHLFPYQNEHVWRIFHPKFSIIRDVLLQACLWCLLETCLNIKFSTTHAVNIHTFCKIRVLFGVEDIDQLCENVPWCLRWLNLNNKELTCLDLITSQALSASILFSFTFFFAMYSHFLQLKTTGCLSWAKLRKQTKLKTKKWNRKLIAVISLSSCKYKIKMLFKSLLNKLLHTQRDILTWLW